METFVRHKSGPGLNHTSEPSKIMEPGGEPTGREKVGGTGSGGVGVMMNLPVEGSDRLRLCWEFSPNNSILLQGSFSLHSSANY